YGASGSGKSRAAYEIIRQNLSSVDRLFVINPSASPSQNDAISESLYKLSSTIKETDTVLCDNFPDGLQMADVDQGLKAVEIITSVSHPLFVIITLNPKFQEQYVINVKRKVPRLFVCELQYGKESLRNVIIAYSIPGNIFKKIHDQFIASDLNKIVAILWEKEPTPLTVLDYYKELNTRIEKEKQEKITYPERAPNESFKNINAVELARALPRRTDYYDHQFQLISANENRKCDVEFLSALKLCYDLGLSRSGEKIRRLRKAIFRDNKFD